MPPEAAPDAPAPVLALIGGLITKVGVYILLRLMGEVFVDQPAMFYEALGWIVRDRSEAFQRKLFHDNAVKFYELG